MRRDQFMLALGGLIIWMAAALAYAAPASADPEQEYKTLAAKADAFLAQTKLHKYRDKWMQHIERAERYVAGHPKHARACDALDLLGRLYSGMADVSHLKKDRELGAAAFEKLGKTCRSSPLGDDGYYQAALIHLRLNDPDAARRALLRCVTQYPKGDRRAKCDGLLRDLGPGEKNLAAEGDDAEPPPEPETAPPSGKMVVLRPDESPILLLALKTSSQTDRSRLALTFTRLPPMTQGELPAADGRPRRLYFDFGQTLLAPEFTGAPGFADARLSALRIGQYKADVVRVVVEATDSAGKVAFATTIAPPTITLDILNVGAAPEAAAEPAAATVKAPPAVSRSESPVRDGTAGETEPVVKEAAGTPPENGAAQTGRENEAKREGVVAAVLSESTENKTPPAVQTAGQEAEPSGGKVVARRAEEPTPIDDFAVRTVVIDPGHGGEDSGAIGKGKTREKDVVLAVAKKLKLILEKEQGLHVILTRSSDKTMGLFDRTKVANDAQADLFLSIHANANRRSKFSGAETWYLNNASDNYSARLAKRENEVFGKEVSDLDFILTDLSMNANVDDSILLAKLVQKAMLKKLRGSYSGVDDRGVRRALFHVLLYARMPAILVETSFISNPTEEKRLKDPKYQETLARGIAEGVRLYAEKQRRLAQSR
ncbi:MAG: hypothetical protein C4523_06180 [Myxococcales bacterium]|nr:MAG: hypothetical protein C4523_06180 [Myxococcales bacterium]